MGTLGIANLSLCCSFQNVDLPLLLSSCVTGYKRAGQKTWTALLTWISSLSPFTFADYLAGEGKKIHKNIWLLSCFIKWKIEASIEVK